ncbi:hypothetical protein ACRCUN_13835 [Mycobacterium sp. LTG2003]
MPKWWPWGRSADSAAAQTASPPAPVIPPTPSWQRMAPLQRTVGLESTAQLAGFTESLTTSQNPGFTRPVQLLAAENADRLPVLNLARSAPSASAPPPAPPAQPTPRTWNPRFPSVQRAHVGIAAPIQRTAEGVAEVDEPAPHVYAVDATDVAYAGPKAMVEASDPDERRPLDVADEPAPPPGPAPELPAPSVSAPTAPPSAAPTPVQRTPSDTGMTSPVVQPLPKVHEHTPTAAPLRTLSSVQRLPSSSPLPALRTLTAAEPPAPVSGNRPEVEAPQNVPGGVSSNALGSGPTAREAAAIQRTPLPDASNSSIAESAQSPTPTVVPIDADAPAEATTEPSAVPATPPTPAPNTSSAPPELVVHRIAVTPDQPSSTTTSMGAPPRASQAPTTAVQRLPVVQARPLSRTEPIAAAPARLGSPAVQRSPAEASARPPVPAAAEGPHVRSDQSPREIPTSVQLPSSTAVSHSPEFESLELFVSDRFAPADPASGAAEPEAVQRMTLPVAHSTPQPAAGPPRSTAELSAPSIVQRSTAAGRRLVVLPPVRRSGEVQRSAESTQPHEHSDVFHNPRPIGLQRMFGPSPDRFEHVTTAAVGDSHSFAETSTHETPLSTGSSDRTSYDAATNTITFAPPSVQRETAESTPEPAPVGDSAPPSTEVPVAGPMLTAAPAIGAPAPAAPDVDELVNRLYDPLAARLRAELWLDRERAGVLMDLGR